MNGSLHLILALWLALFFGDPAGASQDHLSTPRGSLSHTCIYLYAHGNSVNLTDPSGNAVREVQSNLELGQLVEDVVSADFQVQRPSAALYNRSIHTILSRLPGYRDLDRLRPDLVDVYDYEVYDVKSWGETPEGAAKVQLYVSLLKDARINPDPDRNRWHAGTTYKMKTPVFQVPGKSKIYAQVYPAFVGVIPYKLYEVDSDDEGRRIPVPVVVPQELRRLMGDTRQEREWRFAPQFGYNAARYTAVVGVAAITGYGIGQAAARAAMTPLLTRICDHHTSSKTLFNNGQFAHSRPK